MPEQLAIRKLCKSFSGLRVLTDVELSVEPGERRAIIGPNGAGKTTLFNVVSGELQPTSGQVLFEGRDVTGLPPHRMCGLGVARTFQKNNLFMQLTTFENVRLAVQGHQKVAQRWFIRWQAVDSVNLETESILRRLELWPARDRLVKDLSYGEQRQLELGIALAAQPKVLLLDEPTAGMSPAETAHAIDLIAALPRDLTLLIIEHDMDAIFQLADRIAVLNYGEVLADGPPEAVKADPKVREVYLGA